MNDKCPTCGAVSLECPACGAVYCGKPAMPAEVARLVCLARVAAISILDLSRPEIREALEVPRETIDAIAKVEALYAK